MSLHGWPLKAVGIVLMTVLAGAPALASVCDSLCSQEAANADEPADGHQAGHHAPSGHDHHAAAPAHHEASPADSPELIEAAAASCCNHLEDPRNASLTTARTARSLTPSARIAILPATPVADSPVHSAIAPRPAGPPGVSTLPRPPLVLRI